MKRWLLLVVGVVLLVIASKVLVEDLAGIDFAATVTRLVTEPGPGAAAAVVLLLIGDLLLPIPSSLVMVLSGAVFGTVKGTLIAIAGSIGCSIAGFELARRYGRSAALRIAGARDIAHLERTFARYGAGAVLVTRALPIMKEAMSVVAGLSKMRRSTFVAATLAGTVPEAALYSWAGARSRDAGSIAPAAVIVLALLLAGWLVWRNRGTAAVTRPTVD